jgi:hypothetical protein
LRAGDCVGCEREGTREASYKVGFAGSDGQSFDCTFADEARWRAFVPGSRWKYSVGVLTGAGACGSLRQVD